MRLMMLFVAVAGRFRDITLSSKIEVVVADQAFSQSDAKQYTVNQADKELEEQNLFDTVYDRILNGATQDLRRMIIKDNSWLNRSLFSYDRTPLQLAAEMNQRHIVELLLESKADSNSSQADGLTALYLAAMKGYERIVKLLLESGAAVDPLLAEHSNDDKGHTPLMVASTFGYSDIADLLIKYRADINAATQVKGITSLLFAIYENQTSVVELLLERGANIELASHEGATPLMVASKHGYSNLVNLLLWWNANVTAVDVQGYDALDFAEQNGFQAIAKNLRQVMQSPKSNPLLIIIPAGFFISICICFLVRNNEAESKSLTSIKKSLGVPSGMNKRSFFGFLRQRCQTEVSPKMVKMSI